MINISVNFRDKKLKQKKSKHLWRSNCEPFLIELQKFWKVKKDTIEIYKSFEKVNKIKTLPQIYKSFKKVLKKLNAATDIYNFFLKS